MKKPFLAFALMGLSAVSMAFHSPTECNMCNTASYPKMVREVYSPLSIRGNYYQSPPPLSHIHKKRKGYLSKKWYKKRGR